MSELELQSRPMSALQIRAVTLCVALNLVDGFDVLAMTFAAPAIAAAWRLQPDMLGVLFSAGLLGMALGALALSPVADRLGRRPIILMALVIVSCGMIASGIAAGTRILIAARFVTGIGIGGMISCTTAMVHEYSSERRRALAMGLMAASFPAGALLGGAAALVLLRSGGWPSIFFVGAGATVLLAIPVFFYLPESLAFLDAAPSRAAAERSARLRNMLGLPVTPAADRPTHRRSVSFAAIAREGLGTRATVMAGLFLLVMTSFYFILSWMPKLLALMGQSAQAGITAGMMINLGGAAGGFVTGLAVPHIGLARTCRVAIATMAAGIALTGLVSSEAALRNSIALLMGFAMFGTMGCAYSLLSAAFPANVRATAIGLVTTSGRIGSVAGPALGGWLIARGSTPSAVCILLALPAIAALPFARQFGSGRPVADKPGA